MSPRDLGSARPLGHWLIQVAWAPVPVLIAAMLVLGLVGSRGPYESQPLLMVLNFLFSTVASLLVAILIGRSCLARGSPGLLLLGCGVMMWGAAGTISPAPLGVMVQSVLGGLLGWTGRAAQFLGGAYMLVAAIASVRGSRAWRLPIEDALREQTLRYELVVAGAHAAIWDWGVLKRGVAFSPRWKALRGYADLPLPRRQNRRIAVFCQKDRGKLIGPAWMWGRLELFLCNSNCALVPEGRDNAVDEIQGNHHNRCQNTKPEPQ